MKYLGQANCIKERGLFGPRVLKVDLGASSGGILAGRPKVAHGGLMEQETGMPVLYLFVYKCQTSNHGDATSSIYSNLVTFQKPHF